MTRKIKRLRNFEIELTLKSDDFIRPPREGQRNWLLNRALREFTSDLQATDDLASRFVPGRERHLPSDMSTAELDEEQIMEDWQRPLMEAMAEIAAGPQRDVLEIGFGRGISASLIQQHGARSHTIIECNPTIVKRFESWKSEHATGEVRIIEGMWQDVIEDLGEFDSVFFHTYALNEAESIEYLGGSTTFAEHFFPAAAARLRSGGIFTYLTNEIDSLSRSHQRSLFRFFRTLQIRRVALEMPDDVADAWWANSMVVIQATK